MVDILLARSKFNQKERDLPQKFRQVWGLVDEHLYDSI